MARKKLLTEAELRRFMTLADLAPTTRLDELYGEPEEDLEDLGDESEELSPEEVDIEPSAPELDVAPELDAIEDAPANEQLPPEAVEALEGAVESMMGAVADVLSPLGVHISTERDEDGLEDEFGATDDLGAEAPLEEPMAEPMEEPMADMGEEDPLAGLEDEEEIEEAHAGAKTAPHRAAASVGSPRVDPDADKDYNHPDMVALRKKNQQSDRRQAVTSESKIVNEVARRVAKKLQTSSKREALAEKLAQRVFDRLAKK